MVTDPLTFVERLVDRDVELRAFILRLVDPEDLGHAVSAEVRKAACEVLHIPVAHGTFAHDHPETPS